MDLPFDGDGQQVPFGADGITATVARTALLEFSALEREAVLGRDLDQELSDDEKLGKVRDLRELWANPARKHPPAGVPRQVEHRKDRVRRAERRITDAVRRRLAQVTNVSGRPINVIGPSDGTLDERTAAFRSFMDRNEPVVSVSAGGCMRCLLATGDPTAASLSIMTYIPGRPLYAAMVTAKAALLSDCAGSWRLTLADGWLAMTGEPLVADPDPHYIVLPRSLERLAPGLRKHYEEPLFPRDTSSAIAQAVLGGAVPVAVHFTEQMLNAAIFPVAVGHGMVVRVNADEFIEKPWDASRHLYKALKGEIAFGDEHIIGRDMWAIKRAARVLTRERRLQEDVHPLDSELDEDDDIFDFPFDDDPDDD